VAVPADGEVGTERDLGRALRAADGGPSHLRPLRRHFLPLVELFAQIVGKLA